MKRSFLAIVLAILLLFSSFVPVVYATSGIELWFCNSEPTYSITAFYDVLNEDVENVSVVFASSVAGEAFANYIAANNQLRISIASADPIRFEESLCTVSATVVGGGSVIPELRLTYLKFNGLSSACQIKSRLRY